ncbi:MAG: hypothetical protein Q9195_001029 [Heterodermia aff. obscurata]
MPSQVLEPPIKEGPLSSVTGSPELSTVGDSPLVSPDLELHSPRPSPKRCVTAPEPSDVLSPFPKTSPATLPLRPRNRSPYMRTHMRSRSSNSPLSAPQSRSTPVPDVARAMPPAIARPPSPSGPLARRRSPLRRVSDEVYPTYGGQVEIGETIAEGKELDLTPRPLADAELSQTSPIHSTFPRSRRRPSSPLHQISQTSGSPHVLRTSLSSPSLAATNFNEPYPCSYSYASSSISSTPTSFRSRSPSISSLETIPDTPDAELEAENVAKLKAAADKEGDSEGEEGVRRRSSLGGVMKDKRKRWSVCGAERRGDLDLETIWED